MKYIVFNLEWNTDHHKSKFETLKEEIIQISASKVLDNGEIDRVMFNEFIKPKIYNKIEGHVLRKSRTKQDTYKNGDNFLTCFKKFKRWANKHRQ